jgi:putative redox protein
MAIGHVSARWTGEELNFIGTDSKGRQVAMGGENISPSRLLLLGLAGCTGMDVISILQKKRLNITSLEVEIAAHQADDYPKPFHTIEIKYIIKGDNIDPKAVERAIDLSQNKYCVVSQTLQQPLEIKTSFSIES